MILIIAFGNDLREDDGAGLVLAERLEQAWRATGVAVRRVAVRQLAPELASEVAAANVSAVVFVDARLTATAADQAVEVAAITSAHATAPVVGHHANPAMVLAYAGLLVPPDRLPAAWLVTAPGMAFGHGQGLSANAQAAIDRAFSNQPRELLELVYKLSTRSSRPSSPAPPAPKSTCAGSAPLLA